MSWRLYYKVKQRGLPFLYGCIAKCILRFLGKVCRINVEGEKPLLAAAKNGSCLLVFWHNRLVMAPEILYPFARHFPYAILSSYSRDGEIIAVVTSLYGNVRPLRVQHNKKAAALKEMIDHLKSEEGILVVTPDGPRGPMYKMKVGAVAAAKASSSPIFLMSWKADRYWTLKTWDRLRIPKPFANIEAVFSEPIYIEGDVEEQTALLEKKMESLEKKLL